MSANGQPLSLERTIPGVGRIEFEESEKSRAYWFTPEGNKRRTRLPSVTTILRATWPKPGLFEWYAAQGGDAKNLVAQATARGKAVHRFVETFMASGELLPVEEFPAEYHGYIQSAASFLFDYFPTPVAVERLVVHPEFRYAGRLDLIAMIDGVTTLLDFKSNTHGRVYPEAHVQACAYAVADERCGGEPIAQTMVVGLAENGTYNAVIGAPAEKVWASALGFYDEIRKFERRLEAVPS